MAINDTSLYESDLIFQGDILKSQRYLRSELLDNQKITTAAARDLAAHLLLNLDDLDGCWSIATRWLLDRLGCSRVDTGFGSPESVEYFPSYAEAKSVNYAVPTLGGSAVDNRDKAMQAMWFAERPLVFEDVKQDRRIEMGLRRRLSKAETRSKFAAPLRIGNRRFGLICADWTKDHVPWEGGLYDQFHQTVSEVLSPIIFVAHDIDRQRVIQWTGPQGTLDNFAQIAPQTESLRTLLSEAETEVAQLVARGMSYKEIANRRGRSFSTIDHQLRSIRKKLGISSTAELIRLLAQHKF
ncbi:MAG: helix-turn-helix transcriptional regulator [Rhodobacteraceae bacterium]|nr:helix-turn-helix transcriptional regulator [Paracoccaceae bacterium]